MGTITIEYGYDRHQRSWCIIVKDEYGYEIESEYCGDQKWCRHSIKELQKKYNHSKIVKIKAY